MLLEAGENQSVLEYADAILTAKNRRGGDSVNSNGKRDVALASSMAMCEYAQKLCITRKTTKLRGRKRHAKIGVENLEKVPGGKSKSFAPELKDAIYRNSTKRYLASR